MSHKLAAALAVLLLLGGCQRAPEPAPSPSETATPTVTPAPSEEPKELWDFPMDDTHDAFEVDTGGKLGTVLVTVERGEELEEGDYRYLLFVWDRADLTTPIQTFEETRVSLGAAELSDVNFDGHTDFIYEGGTPSLNWPFSLYVWDEEQGQFLYKTTLLGRSVSVDEETQTIHSSVHYTGYSGAEETYRWENGELVPFRKETYELLDDDLQLTGYVTYEWVDGQWQEVSREEYAMQGL